MEGSDLGADGSVCQDVGELSGGGVFVVSQTDAEMWVRGLMLLCGLVGLWLFFVCVVEEEDVVFLKLRCEFLVFLHGQEVEGSLYVLEPCVYAGGLLVIATSRALAAGACEGPCADLAVRDEDFLTFLYVSFGAECDALDVRPFLVLALFVSVLEDYHGRDFRISTGGAAGVLRILA